MNKHTCEKCDCFGYELKGIIGSEKDYWCYVCPCPKCLLGRKQYEFDMLKKYVRGMDYQIAALTGTKEEINKATEVIYKMLATCPQKTEEWIWASNEAKFWIEKESELI